MKLCINCYTENPEDEVFCSKCGMSLIGAPTGEEAVRLEEEAATLEQRRRKRRLEDAQRPLQQRLTASGSVYIYGHLFAAPWGASSALGLAGRLALSVGTDAPLDDGRAPLLVPYSGQPVGTGDLGLKLLEAAFVSLAQGGYVSLGLDKTTKQSYSGEVVAMIPEKSGDDLPPSLERSIMDVLTSAPQERRLKYVVRRLTNGLWMSVLAIVMQSLREAHLLERPEGVLFGSWVPTEEAAPLLSAMAEEAETLKASLDTFAAANPHLHERLVEDAVAGVRGFLGV